MMKDKFEMMRATANMNHVDALAYAKKVNTPVKHEVAKEEEKRIFDFLKLYSSSKHNDIIINAYNEIVRCDSSTNDEEITGCDEIETSGTFTDETQVLANYVRVNAPHIFEGRCLYNVG